MSKRLTSLGIQLYPAGTGALWSEYVGGVVIRHVNKFNHSGGLANSLILHQSEWDKLLAGALTDGRITTSVTCDTGDVWTVQRYTDTGGVPWVRLTPPPLSSGPFSVQLGEFNSLKEA